MPAKESRGDSSEKAMQEWICRENIKNLRSQLATPRDEGQRAILSALLAEQEANLERLKSTSQK